MKLQWTRPHRPDWTRLRPADLAHVVRDAIPARNTIRSEWTKLRSVRSTWILALTAIVAGVGLSVLGMSDLLSTPASQVPPDWDPTAGSLKGFLFAQLVIGMLGAFSITPEYASGMIGGSLAMVPSRSRLLVAKTLVVGAIALVVSLFTTLISFTVVQLSVKGAGLPAAGLGDPGVLGALVGATLYLTFVALIGVAVGVLTRSSTSSLAVLVGALLLVPALAPGLPGAIGDAFGRYWPITAGQAAYTVVPVGGMVSPGSGLFILLVATVVVTVVSHSAFRTRDV
ncbi:ABC transporter permease [Amycolatopsis pithecellobii]|uniref:ABC transporter permease subunit n=1 Tax=Amycolatopsis pithecellobii TaxID=664692 RepID=A0A6N7Z343_9PSEU|nr:ABC transporter permease [Amycolatopsis pithecellobii]MTD53256.1 ABC transporter permease subunit [Amycolatopsis pithecellobii]